MARSLAPRETRRCRKPGPASSARVRQRPCTVRYCCSAPTLPARSTATAAASHRFRRLLVQAPSTPAGDAVSCGARSRRTQVAPARLRARRTGAARCRRCWLASTSRLATNVRSVLRGGARPHSRLSRCSQLRTRTSAGRAFRKFVAAGTLQSRRQSLQGGVGSVCAPVCSCKERSARTGQQVRGLHAEVVR